MAKIKKISLDFDENPIALQLISLKESIDYNKFFFIMNKQNKFKLERVKNFVVRNNSIEYEFLYMKSYDEDGNNICSVIANKSFKNYNNIPIDIFNKNNDNEYYLLKNNENIDFIMRIYDLYLEFSVHLLPSGMISFVNEECVFPRDLIYQCIQENE